jgi:hypothetical protein
MAKDRPRRYPRTPRLVIDVTQEVIDRAIVEGQRDSSHLHDRGGDQGITSVGLKYRSGPPNDPGDRSGAGTPCDLPPCGPSGGDFGHFVAPLFAVDGRGGNNAATDFGGDLGYMRPRVRSDPEVTHTVRLTSAHSAERALRVGLVVVPKFAVFLDTLLAMIATQPQA